MYANYSVLMSVYYKEKPEYLRESLESIYTQTVHTNDFVFVCDGPLNDELDSVIEEYKNKFGEAFNVIRLPENVGLGRALNEGMKHCKNEIIGRMDSDDISFQDRFEKQLIVFEKNPQIGICSGIVNEFDTSTNNIICKRVVPEKHEEIIDFAKKRNPFNHPCVMYKRTDILNAGGYRDFYLLEDYYLWVRMLLNGTVGYNLQEPLLYMRAGSEMYKRRAGMKYVHSQNRLFREMKSLGFISYLSCATSMVERTAASLIPNKLRQLLFKRIVRY